MVHRYHSHMALTLRHLRRLRIILCPSDTHQLPLRVLYHQLLISARSPLIPRDRHLSISMDNTIYAMTPNATHDSSTRLHYIQLFLNPSTGSPYLLYTFDGQPNANSLLSAQRLTITTSLPSSLPSTKRPRRYRMMRTTSHSPNWGETITFPADSVQYQMTILTLVTHMLLSVSLLRLTLLSWRPVRQPTAHQQTLGIILVTLALKQYHPIWFTSGPPLLPTVPSAQSTSGPQTPLLPSRSLGIAPPCTAPAAHVNLRKRKHHSPPLTPANEDDNGQG